MKILVLYTGGTFGMEVASEGSSEYRVPDLDSQTLKKRVLDRVPEVKQLAEISVDVVYNRDSSQIGATEWIELALRIEKSNSDGVVIIHGTDTMVYTANALTLLLGKLRLPVILTGAQRPLSVHRTDARSNLIAAVEIAATAPRPQANQVMICFRDHLFLGSRTRKRSATEFAAFESPRFPVLASVGSTIQYSDAFRRLKPMPAMPSDFKPRFSNKVPLVHITPNFPGEVFDAGAFARMDGMVLVAFASGTGPTETQALLDALKRARSHQVPVVVATERSGWEQNPRAYPAGSALLEAGAVWAGDATPEFAWTKTAFISAQPNGRAEFPKYWKN